MISWDWEGDKACEQQKPFSFIEWFIPDLSSRDH